MDKAVKDESTLNMKLGDKIHKSIFKKYQNHEFYSFFIDNIWGANLANIKLLRRYNQGVLFYCVLLI